MQSTEPGLAKKITTVFLFILLVGGVGVTAWGLLQLSWPQALPWSKWAFVQYISFIGACAVLVVSGSYWSKVHPYFLGVVLAISLAVLSGAVWPLIVVCWFGLASAVLGRAVNVALDLTLKGESWLIHLLVGGGVYGTVVGLLAHLPVNYPGVYGIILTLPLLLWWRSAVDCFNGCIRLVLESAALPTRNNWLGSAVAVVALIHFVVALMPELGHDALAMHLFVPAHMSTRHQWGFDAGTYVWALMPMLGDWIFSLNYMLAGETAARLVNVSFILVLSWLVRDLVLWSGGTIVGARWATLIFLSTPLTFTESSSLFIESVWAVFVVAGMFALLKTSSSSDSSRSCLVPAALLLGFAASTKAVTLTILPVFIFFVLWQYKSFLKGTKFLTWLKAVALFLAMALIPYSTAWVLTGNPVFPFFNGIFESPYYPAVNFESASIFGKGITWDVLYRATFDSGRYLEATAGASGFQWMLLFLPASALLLAKGGKNGVSLLIIGVLIVLVVFQSVSYFRYAFPAWVILTAVIGLGLGRSECATGNLIKVVWGVGALSTAVLNLLFLSAAAPYRDFPLVSIVDKTYREAYLLERLPLRNAINAVNQINVGKSPVAIFAQPLAAGIESDALYSNWYNFRFQADINAASSVEAIGKLLLGRGVDFVILDSSWSGGPEKRELISSATEKIADYGSVSVLKVRDDLRFTTELVRNPEFASVDGWVLAPGASYDVITQAITVSVASSASQAVSVSPGRRYINTVVARCYEETSLGRVQINWLDREGQFIRADIKTFDCRPDWTEQTMEGVVPPSAAVAIVYTVGHTATPIQFRKNSLRQ
jgi:hypothetical protein